jgi:hypothetical protein
MNTASTHPPSRFRSLLGASALVLAGALVFGCSPEETENESSEQAVVGGGTKCAPGDFDCQTSADFASRRTQIEARSAQASVTIDTKDTFSNLGYMAFAYYDYNVKHRFYMEFEGSGTSNQFTVRRWICDGAPFQGFSLGCVKFSENVLKGSRVNVWADAKALTTKLGRTITGDLTLSLDGAARAAFYNPSLGAARRVFFGLDMSVDPMKAGFICNSQCAGEATEHAVAVGLIFLAACSPFTGPLAVTCGVAGLGFGIFGGKSQTFCYSECMSCYQNMRTDCASDPAHAGCIANTPFKCGKNGEVLVKGVAGSDR